MNKTEFRTRAYDCYVTGFKQTVTTSNACDSRPALRYRRYLQRRLRPWLERVSRDAEIADLGCGDGMLLRVFQEMGFQKLHGVEGSPEMHRLCQARFPEVEKGRFAGLSSA
jgi:trans-aconitate methyltransferase